MSREGYELFLKTLREDGVVGLYCGVVPHLMYSATSWGVYFALYEYFKEKFSHFRHGETLATIVAGVLNVLLTNPLSVLAAAMVA